MTLREALTSCTAADPLVPFGGGFAVRLSGIVALAWDGESALSLLDGEIPEDALVADLSEDPTFEDEMGDKFAASVSSSMVRMAGSRESDDVLLDSIDAGIVPTSERMGKICGSRPLLLRLAQWGGFGGMPQGAGQGIGVGTGPMQGNMVFDNPIARQQFDISLDAFRKLPHENGWDVSLETRMQDAPLYGHQRDEIEHYMENYTKTFRERQKLNRQRFLDRMRADRAKVPTEDPNSVAAIKRMPKDPKLYLGPEDRLSSRRQAEDPEGKRTGVHGPESDRVIFPPVRTAQVQIRTADDTPVQTGLTTVFAPGHENAAAMDKVFNPPPKGRRLPPAAKRPVSGPTEVGLSTLHGSSNLSISPSSGYSPMEQEHVGVGGHEARKRPPWGAVGHSRENGLNFGEEEANLWGGNSSVRGTDYLMNRNETGTDTGEAAPLFTDDDVRNFGNRFRQIMDMGERERQETKRKKRRDLGLEGKLETEHGQLDNPAARWTAQDWQADSPYPNAGPNYTVPTMGRGYSSGHGNR
jgi:hypothetical protein